MVHLKPRVSHLDNIGFVPFQNLQGLGSVGVHHQHEGMASVGNEPLPAPRKARLITKPAANRASSTSHQHRAGCFVPQPGMSTASVTTLQRGAGKGRRSRRAATPRSHTARPRPGPTPAPPLSPIRRPPVGRAEGACQCARRQLDVHCEGLHGEAGSAGPSPAAGGLPTTARLAATATQEAQHRPARRSVPPGSAAPRASRTAVPARPRPLERISWPSGPGRGAAARLPASSYTISAESCCLSVAWSGSVAAWSKALLFPHSHPRELSVQLSQQKRTPGTPTCCALPKVSPALL